MLAVSVSVFSTESGRKPAAIATVPDRRFTRAGVRPNQDRSPSSARSAIAPLRVHDQYPHDTRPSWSTRCGAIAYRRALFGG